MSTSGTTDETTWRLLVVDDEPETGRLLRRWFEGQPYEILEARGAEEGIAMAERVRPDLILMDIRMPGTDGLCAARRLKSDPLTRGVPVVLLTACREMEAKIEAFEAGADDYVTKPFELEEVDARIRAMLRKRELYMTLEATVSDLKASKRRLEDLLVVDEKTGLFNYSHFRQRLGEEWLRSERYGTALSLVMLDLDDFKRVNDTLGHPAGDEILKEFATLVAGGARATDTPARFGGEEFAILLPHTDEGMAAQVAERVLRAVRRFVFLESEHPTRLTVSAGVATHPCESVGVDTPEALVRAADQALYQAKKSGRDRFVVYRAGRLGEKPPSRSSPYRTERRPRSQSDSVKR